MLTHLKHLLEAKCRYRLRIISASCSNANATPQYSRIQTNEREQYRVPWGRNAQYATVRGIAAEVGTDR